MSSNSVNADKGFPLALDITADINSAKVKYIPQKP